MCMFTTETYAKDATKRKKTGGFRAKKKQHRQQVASLKCETANKERNNSLNS